MLDDYYAENEAALRAAADVHYRRDLARAADELVQEHRADPFAALDAALIRCSATGGRAYAFTIVGARYEVSEHEIRAELHRAVARDTYRQAT